MREQRLELFLIRNKASDTVTEFVTDHWVLIVSKQKFTVPKRRRPRRALARVCQPLGQVALIRLKLLQ